MQIMQLLRPKKIICLLQNILSGLFIFLRIYSTIYLDAQNRKTLSHDSWESTPLTLFPLRLRWVVRRMSTDCQEKMGGKRTVFCWITIFALKLSIQRIYGDMILEVVFTVRSKIKSPNQSPQWFCCYSTLLGYIFHYWYYTLLQSTVHIRIRTFVCARSCGHEIRSSLKSNCKPCLNTIGCVTSLNQ